MADTACDCYGIDKRTRCVRDATQEDGYCDECRCPHGACDGHWEEGEWTPDLWYTDPVTFMERFKEVARRAAECEREMMREHELRDGAEVQDEEVFEGGS